MSEKFTPLKNRNCIILLSAFLIFSCKPKDRFHWNVGLSAPKNYVAGDPHVAFFYKGIGVSGASSLIGINPGWGSNSGGFSSGEEYTNVPDSIHLSWRCSFDLVNYEGGFKLPREKMIKLFQSKPTDVYGEPSVYNSIVGGMAPGGNVCVWMETGTLKTVISCFKVKAIDTDKLSNPNTGITIWNSAGEEAKDILKYIKIHGVPYSVWEKGEPEYKYDVGFCNLDTASNEYDFAITGYSKDGTPIYYNKKLHTLRNLSYIKKNVANEVKNNIKLPVHLELQWISPDNEDWFKCEVVLPNNLDELFNSNSKSDPYYRLLINLKKRNPLENCIHGDILLISKNSETRIMGFRMPKLNNKTIKYYYTRLNLPKNYKFPKFPGRHELKFPKLDYWQEP